MALRIWPWPSLDSLTIRVLAYLSLALLPLGIVAILQTKAIDAQNRAGSASALQALTRQAAAAETEIIQNAFGAADAIGTIVPELHDDRTDCIEYLARFQENSGIYSYVAFIPVSGLMTCSSVGRDVDFSDFEDFIEALDVPMRNVVAPEIGIVSQMPVLVISAPVRRDGTLVGFVTVSVPQSVVEARRDASAPIRPVEEILFNAAGEVLTWRSELPDGSLLQPNEFDLAALAEQGAQTFEAETTDGVSRVFAVTAAVPGVAFALGAWPEDGDLGDPLDDVAIPLVLPILMWGASLLVAFLALDRLVIRTITSMGTQMRAFAADRSIPEPVDEGVRLPRQLRQIQSDFLRMADNILHDEAREEDRLREKNILIKEVYHRVKNNLQLITSIMNLQIRAAQSTETKVVLKRLQDRIMGLAQIHRTLYQSERMDRISAADITREVSSWLLDTGLSDAANVRAVVELQDVPLYPDQAMPLSLFVSEAMTNAIKYLGTTSDGDCRIAISLRRTDPDNARIEISNTLGSERPPSGTMLGLKLVRAFAAQLGGVVNIDENDRLYTISIDFPLEDYDPEKRDF